MPVKQLINFKKSKKNETLRQKGAYKIVFRYLNPSFISRQIKKKFSVSKYFS